MLLVVEDVELDVLVELDAVELAVVDPQLGHPVVRNAAAGDGADPLDVNANIVSTIRTNISRRAHQRGCANRANVLSPATPTKYAPPEVCQDFGHYAARKSLPSSVLLLKSAITSAGCLYPIDECGRRRSWNPSIHSTQANFASSLAADVLLRCISFSRLAQRLPATASSRRQPVLPTERRTSFSRARPARRELVYWLPRMPF